MNFDDYQKRALTTVHQSKVDPLMQQTIWALGIAGEAGEIIEKWKKIIAYKDGKIIDEDLAELAKELGDIIWYVAVMANSLGLSLNDIVQANLKKLSDRQKRDVIKGSGDNR